MAVRRSGSVRHVRRSLGRAASGADPADFGKLLVPREHHGMGLRGGLWVPMTYSSTYKEAYLRDAGIHHLGSLHYLFGCRTSVQEFEAQIKTFTPRPLLAILARMANYLAHEGVGFCSEDEIQRAVFQGINIAARQRCWPIAGEYKRRKDRKALDFPCFNFEIILALLCETIAHGFDRTGLNPDQEQAELSLAIGMAGNIVYEADQASAGYNDDSHRRFMRENLAVAPCHGTIHTFFYRVGRLCIIYNDVLGAPDDDLRRLIDSCLVSDIGVTCDQLMSLIMPLNLSWFGNNDFRTNPCYKTATIPQPDLREKMTTVLDGMSLTPEEYTSRMRALKVRLGDRFYRSADVLALMVQKPVLRVADGEFLLMAPQLLLRKIELAMYSAFIRQREKTVPIERLSSPLGHAFERYAMGLLAERINGAAENSLLVSQFTANPAKASGEELADGIIDHRDACVVFEAKHRPLSLRALDVSDDSTEVFDDWVERTFFQRANGSGKNRKRNGALWQLHEAAVELLARKGPTRPRTIIPVVVLSEDMIATIPLYSLFDKAIESRGIFAGLPEVRSFLLASIADIERLNSVDLPARYPTIQAIFVQKSTHTGAREMPWDRFLNAAGCRHNPARVSNRGTDELLRKASMLLPEGQRGKYDKTLTDAADPDA